MMIRGRANGESTKLKQYAQIKKRGGVVMRVKDLSGMTFGTLDVLCFDDKRYEDDKRKLEDGSISRIRRYYLCRCRLCGNVVSVRGENLSSGNTKGCGCDAYQKMSKKRHLNAINTFEYSDDLNCWIGQSNNTNSRFFVDNDDKELVSAYCWYETNHGYMMARLEDGRQILLHRLIMFGLSSADSSVTVDHINRNKLDCRKLNLRLCTPQENSWNVGVHKNSMSGERGVRWHEKTQKWNAYITMDGKFKSLGYYDSIQDAVEARRSAELKYRGEYAPI